MAIYGETVETVRDFTWAPKSLQKVSAAMKLKDAYSKKKKKKMIIPWKESYEQPRHHIKKHITLPTKVCLVKAMVFPAVMNGCERRTINKAEHRRN